MLKSWKFILFFVLCLVVSLALTMPVQHLLPYAKLPNTVRLYGLDGSLVEGRAQQVLANPLILNSVRYRLQPACLVSFKVCYRVSYQQGDLLVAYDTVNGDTEISESRIEYTVAELSRFAPNLPITPKGDLELQIDDLSLLQGKPGPMRGRLIGRGLGVAQAEADIEIGDLKIDIVGDGQQYDFKIVDLDASLDVDGKGNLNANGQYRVEVDISSEVTIDPNIRNLLDLTAKKIKYNQYRIDQSGRLPPHITRQIF